MGSLMPSPARSRECSGPHGRLLALALGIFQPPEPGEPGGTSPGSPLSPLLAGLARGHRIARCWRWRYAFHFSSGTLGGTVSRMTNLVRTVPRGGPGGATEGAACPCTMEVVIHFLHRKEVKQPTGMAPHAARRGGPSVTSRGCPTGRFSRAPGPRIIALPYSYGI